MSYTKKRKTNFKKTRKYRLKKKLYSKKYGGKTKDELIQELTKLINSNDYTNKFDPNEKEDIIKKYTKIYSKTSETWITDNKKNDMTTINTEKYQSMFPDPTRDIQMEYETKQLNKTKDNSIKNILEQHDYLLVSNNNNHMKNNMLFLNNPNTNPLIFIGDYYIVEDTVFIQKGIIFKIKPNNMNNIQKIENFTIIKDSNTFTELKTNFKESNKKYIEHNLYDQIINKYIEIDIFLYENQNGIDDKTIIIDKLNNIKVNNKIWEINGEKIIYINKYKSYYFKDLVKDYNKDWFNKLDIKAKYGSIIRNKIIIEEYNNNTTKIEESKTKLNKIKENIDIDVLDAMQKLYTLSQKDNSIVELNTEYKKPFVKFESILNSA